MRPTGLCVTTSNGEPMESSRNGDYMRRGSGLNPNAAVHIRQLIAGVRVQIVRRAAIELVPLPKLAAHNQAQRHGAKRGRNPANRLQKVRIFHINRLVGCASEVRILGTAAFLHVSSTFRPTSAATEFGEEPHAKHDSAGRMNIVSENRVLHIPLKNNARSVPCLTPSYLTSTC